PARIRGRDLRDGFGIQVRSNDTRTAPGERRDDRLADPPARPRDEGEPAGQVLTSVRGHHLASAPLMSSRTVCAASGPPALFQAEPSMTTTWSSFSAFNLPKLVTFWASP